MRSETEQPWIFNRWTDWASVGGLALFILIPLLLFPSVESLLTGASLASALHIAVNFPHFIASYRIIYASRERIWRYRNATIVVPFLLLIGSVFALSQSGENGLYVHLLVVASGLYIGIHYTGQTWGMMAVHAHLVKRPFSAGERLLIRAGLYGLAFFHASFFLRFSAQLPGNYLPISDLVFSVGQMAATSGFLASTVGIVLYSKRYQTLPPIGVLIAWASIYVWYAVFSSMESGVFWVQVAHSLQYLIFPARMFVNERSSATNPKQAWLTLLYWYIPLLVGGYFAFRLLPDLLINTFNPLTVDAEFKAELQRLIPIVVSAFLNIHHFFTDGYIWKMRDPKVRAALFMHINQVVKASSDEATPLPKVS